MYRILVVDDEVSICRGLELGLISKDYQVDVVNTGQDAIDIGSQQHYDVLISDLCLPDMLGLEVIRKLKERNPQIITIIITAFPTTESFNEAKRLGVDEYYEKPFHIQAVRDAILRGIERLNLSVA